MGKLNNFIETIRKKPFIISLMNDLKSDIYAVGGVVRDLILNKENKDIDLVIRNVSIDMLIAHLQKFGRVDVVGKSFGVIKFIDSDGIDYDLALPRKEQPTGEGGYRGFDIQSDENLPIEDDLIRRDTKMNAMAININTGKFIDPLGGLDDIKKKQISAANPEAFSDDPLRMIRIVAFASRFGFEIEPETMKMIQDNASRVKEIAPERILTEFDKIVKKGDKFRGAFLLKDTGLLKEIFGGDAGLRMGQNVWEKVKTMGEFIWLLSHNLVDSPAEFYKINLKGDIDTYKEIKALEFAFAHENTTNRVTARSIAHNMYITSPQSLQSGILPLAIKLAAEELLSGKYPKTVGELAVNGNDLMQLGLVGKEIGDAQKTLLLNVYSDSVRNNREELLNLDSRNKNMVKEEMVKPTDKIEYGCLMLFLDVPIWEKITSIIFLDDVYDELGYGIETEPHTTILYGFHDEVTSEDCFNLFKENMPVKPFKIGIKGISFFTGNPKFDVVKFDVESLELTKLNEVMKALPHTSAFPDYHPHITIAYVKPGEGQKYVKPFEKNRMLNGSELVYTWKGHKGNDGDKLMLDGINENYMYNTANSTEQKPTWDINGQQVDINFFVDKYYEWNQGGYESASDKSIQEFLENNYEDFSHDERLKKELYHKLVDNEILDEDEMKKNVRYTAVVLDDMSRTALLKRLGNMIPEGWETIAHHMTINMGAIDQLYEKFLGMTVDLTAHSFATDDKVMAVSVSGFPTVNKLPHITLAVNRANGGKPMMSNQLTDWQKLSEPLILTGKVTEVE